MEENIQFGLYFLFRSELALQLASLLHWATAPLDHGFYQSTTQLVVHGEITSEASASDYK